MSVEITNASICHAEFSSASHREPFLVLLRGQILKQVQDDHQLCSVVFCPYVNSHRSQLIAHNSKICRICIICVPSKFFTKLNFHINPAVKSKVPSWKIFISQLVTMFAPR